MKKIVAISLCLAMNVGAFPLFGMVSAEEEIWIESSDLEHEVIGRYGEAYLERYHPPYNGSILVLHLSGSYYEMAYQYGYLLNQTIIDCYDEMLGGLLGQFGTNPIVSTLVGILLDLGYKTVEPFIPRGYRREIGAIRAGAEAAGVGDPELVEKAIKRVMVAGEVFSCSFFAAWGSRTVNGKMYATRNFDYMPIGGDDYRLITVFKPDEGNAYVTMGYPIFFGNAICGMNEKGVAVAQIGAKNSISTTLGTSWLVALTEVLRGANSAAEGVVIMENYPRAFGMNFMVADGCADGVGKMQAYAIETNAWFKGIFKDNDPKEDVATYKGEHYALKLEEAVFRADAAMDQRIRRSQLADNGPFGDPRKGESYINRYKRQYDMLVAYEKGESFVDYYDKKEIIEARGEKTFIGPKEAITIAKTVAMDDESTISVVYGATDLEFWITFSSMEESGWMGAYANPYIHFDLEEWIKEPLKKKFIEGGMLLAGVSEVDMTPQVGAPMGGYGSRIPPFSTGVNDPIYARALVLDDGEDKVAIVTMDLVYPGSTMHRDICEKIHAETGIEKTNLLICASHTHSGPDPDLTLPGIKEEFVEKISSAIIEADKNKKAARIGIGSSYDYDLSMNRRHPNGPTDPEIGIIKVDDLEGDPMAVLVNFAAHATVLRQENKRFSADYPGYMARKVQSEMGGDVVVMYANGAEGDLETRALSYVGDEDFTVDAQYAAASEMGEELAEDVLGILDEIETVPYMDIKAKFKIAKLPPARISKHFLWFIFWSPPYMGQNIPSMPCDIPIPKDTIRPSHTMVQAIKIGDSVLVTIPGEAIAEIGLNIKDQSGKMGFEHTFVIGLANQYIGYVPTYEEYEIGGYEAGASWYGQMLGELIEAQAINTIQSLYE